MGIQAKYTEDQKAVALAYYEACGGNLTKAAKDCGIPKQTLHRWLNGEAVNDAISQKRDGKKENLADTCEELVWKILGSIDENTILEANLTQRTTAAGTLIDKAQLLRNKPTVITEDVSSLPDDELDRRIAALERTQETERGEVPAADGPEADPAD